MSLLSFSVQNQKAIVLAEASSVPKVMIIAGPNGIGKSTLLYAIKQGGHVLSVGTTTQLFYQGPHRVMRRTNVRRSWLGGGMRWMLDLLTQNDVSGFEGLNFPNAARTPDNVDEAGSTIKHTLGKIENKRQAILASILDVAAKKKEHVNAAALPDIYQPLRTLTEFLLPHLVFDRVDFTDEDNIRCLWKRVDKTGERELDVDDLSSGEKSVVVLFFPLLEAQVRELLDQLEKRTGKSISEPAAAGDQVMLVDEPEQHLHPDLQAKILSYIRALTKDGRVQFILTTHSPTILDQAYDDELYAMSAPTGVVTENQIARIASNAERLEMLKALAGSAYFLTTGRVIVCVEGEAATDDGGPTDAGLLEILYPRATAFTLVPTRGKGNVITTVTGLREHVPEAMFRIRVRGLVDADQGGDGVEGVETLPVAMIENFLLSPAALHTYLRSIVVTTFNDESSVETELRSIAANQRQKEISLRVARRIKPRTFRISGASVDAIKAAYEKASEDLNGMLPAEQSMIDILEAATASVEKILAGKEELAQFRGKPILKEFYQRHVAPTNIGYKPFCLALARTIAEKGTVKELLDPVFDRLQA